MSSRMELRQQKYRSKKRKLFAGALLLFFLVGGGFKVAFADQDIGALLTSWFDKKTVESIDEIELAISVEQQKQTDRLKEVLQKEIELAEQQLTAFVEMEKSNRVEALELYAEELINELEVSDGALEEKIIADLERIIQAAKEEMENVSAIEK